MFLLRRYEDPRLFTESVSTVSKCYLEVIPREFFKALAEATKKTPDIMLFLDLFLYYWENYTIAVCSSLIALRTSLEGAFDSQG